MGQKACQAKASAETVVEEIRRWSDPNQTGGPEALADRSPRPGRVWTRIPDASRDKLVQLALELPELSPRELAVRFTDAETHALHHHGGR